jgi:hypothetical protein
VANSLATALARPGPAAITPALLHDPNPNAGNGNYTRAIQEGMVLRVSGLDRTGLLLTEDVVVSATTPTTFTATFAHAYPKGLTSITAYGNPGPWSTAFDPHGHPGLTPYLSVID